MSMPQMSSLSSLIRITTIALATNSQRPPVVFRAITTDMRIPSATPTGKAFGGLKATLMNWGGVPSLKSRSPTSDSLTFHINLDRHRYGVLM